MIAADGKGIGIVMLTPSFHPTIGGAEKQALELSKALASMGARVRVLTRRGAGLDAEDVVDGVPVHRVFACGGGLINAVAFLVSSFFFLLRRAADYEVIHVHLASSPALAACFAGKLLGKRVVVKVGGGRGIGEIAMSHRTLTGRMKLALLRRMKPRFVAVTEDLKDEMAEFGFGGGVRVVPNGVDTERYRPAREGEKVSLRAEFGWPPGTCFLYVGRLVDDKQLDLFLRTFASADRGGGGAFCALVGSGPEEARLRSAAKDSGLEGAVIFHPPAQRVERFYAAADVFILPSVSEGLSNALLEAMAAGLPVLGSRVGGTREAVVDGETGTLFEPTDAEGLKRAIELYSNDPELAVRQGRAAREAAVAKYSLRSVAERYREIYA